jgi:hypothetical protein
MRGSKLAALLSDNFLPFTHSHVNTFIPQPSTQSVILTSRLEKQAACLDNTKYNTGVNWCKSGRMKVIPCDMYTQDIHQEL